jgi:hypothetical protein
VQILDHYSPLFTGAGLGGSHPVFRSWGYNEFEIKNWFENGATSKMRHTANLYLQEVEETVQKIEESFGCSLPGELVLIPSMGEIDGFARYERGHHSVMLGIDFPDANLDYLKALTAHELSHVFRDHSPEVWGFLGKPLKDVSRDEYLEAMTGREHLVSEGLATLNSQDVFPQVAIEHHHYYDSEEMQWCLNNDELINQSLEKCMKDLNPDPWKYYRPGTVARGSPSRVHYYWAAKKIEAWIQQTPGMSLIRAHQLHADQIAAF